MSQRARANSAPIPFIDVAAQRRRLQPAVDQAIARVVEHCQFILGPEVKAFETALAAFCGARHAVSCASGTDALLLVLMAKGIGPGDAVICPSFTFCATAEVVVLLGATPVFADVDADTFNLDAASLKRAVATAKRHGLKPKAVIPVDLFGLPADHDAHCGGRQGRRPVRARRRGASVRRHVQGPPARHARASDRHELLSGQAARLLWRRRRGADRRCRSGGGAQEPARSRPGHRQVRQRAHRHDQPARHHPGRRADRKAENLSPTRSRRATAWRTAMRRASTTSRSCRALPEGMTSVWAQYTIRLKPGVRDGLAATLKAQGIPTAIYYPKPLHRQEAYKHFPVADGGLPVSDRLADEVISLPMHRLSRRADPGPHHQAVRNALGRN